MSSRVGRNSSCGAPALYFNRDQTRPAADSDRKKARDVLYRLREDTVWRLPDGYFYLGACVLHLGDNFLRDIARLNVSIIFSKSTFN